MAQFLHGVFKYGVIFEIMPQGGLHNIPYANLASLKYLKLPKLILF